MDEFTKIRIIKIMDNYTKNKIPKHLQNQINISYEIRGNNVTLIEKRPAFQSDQWVKIDIAQFRKDEEQWKIYWKDSKGKSHHVDDFKPNKNFEKQLEIVDKDERGMFWGQSGKALTSHNKVSMYVGINDVSNTFETTYISSAMEYSADDGATWTTYDELNPPEFPGDLTILLRERGGQYLPPGAAQNFTFTSKVHMQFTGGDYLMTSSKGAEYSVNGGAWISLPFDQQVKFQPGDVVEVREAARGVFPAGAIETYNFQLFEKAWMKQLPGFFLIMGWRTNLTF